jgi:hypothetical protein
MSIRTIYIGLLGYLVLPALLCAQKNPKLSLETQVETIVAATDASKADKIQLHNLNVLKLELLTQIKTEVAQLTKDANNKTISISGTTRATIQSAAKQRQADYDTLLDSIGTWTTGLTSAMPSLESTGNTPGPASNSANTKMTTTVGSTGSSSVPAKASTNQVQKPSEPTVTTTVVTPTDTVTVTAAPTASTAPTAPTNSSAEASASATVLVDVKPDSLPAGSSSTTAMQLTLDGKNFDDKTIIYFDDRRVLTAITATDKDHATVTLQPGELSTAGYHCFSLEPSLPDLTDHKCQTVSGPAKPGQTIDSVVFLVTNPTPKLTSVDPPSLNTSPVRPISITLTGSSIQKGAQVLWNGRVLCDRPFLELLQLPFSDQSNADTTCMVHVIDETAIRIDLGRDTTTFLGLRRPNPIQVTIRNPNPGGGESNPLALTVTRPEATTSSGSLSTRVFVGTDVSGASSLPTQQKLFIEGDLQHPIPFHIFHPYPTPCSGRGAKTVEDCESLNLPLSAKYINSLDPLNRRAWMWASGRVTALPTQGGTSGLGLANVQTSSDLINQLGSGGLNKVVQGFEALAGTEFVLLKPRSGIPMSFIGGNTRMSMSLAAGGGFITPFSQPDTGQQQYVATQDLINRFTNQPNDGTNFVDLGGGSSGCASLKPAPTASQQCFNAILFVPPDSPRFFKEYYIGPRFKIWYFRPAGEDSSANCVDGARSLPNDVCKTYPAVMDAAIGQNASITAGHQHGLVLKLEGSFPIFLSGAVYVYAAGYLHVTGSSPSIPPLLCNPSSATPPVLVQCSLQQQAVFSPISSPIGLSDPTLFRLKDPGADRDFFRVGIGVDLLQLLEKKIGASSQTTDATKQNASTGVMAPTPSPAKAGSATVTGGTSSAPAK